MEMFENYISAQNKTASNIETILRNFNKDPTSRKNRAYYEERLRRLEEAWSEFEDTDNKIRCLPNTPTDHEYFTSRYLHTSNEYQKIKNIFQIEIKNSTTFSLPKPIATPRHNDNDEGTRQAQIADKTLDELTTKLVRNQRALMRALRRNIDEIRNQSDQAQTEAYYHSKATLIDKYMSDFVLNNDALWQSTNSENIDGYTLDDYYRLEAEAHEILTQLQQQINTEVPKGKNKSEELQIHLPKIQIAKFNGNYLQWVAFKDLYIQMIHNSALSDVQKMLYLATHLAEEPKNLIKHLPVSTSNYEVAWNILVQRYDNQRLIITSLLNNFVSFPKMKNETAQALKSLHDVTKECIFGLKAQKVPVEYWDTIFVHLILRKLDNATQTSFEQSLDDNKRLITLSELLRFIEHRFQSLEAQGKTADASGGKERTKATTATTASTANTCKVCGSTGHPIYYCEKFLKMSVAERLKWTQNKKLCVNCFKSDHVAKKCTSRSCTKCSSKHNTLLHLETTTKTQASGDKQQQPQGSNETSTTANTPVVAAANINQTEDDYVLLATARVKIIGNNGRVGEFRALLDSGSQVNLVSERVINQLSLKASDSSLCIEGIGRKTRNVTRRVNFELRAIHGNYSERVEAFILPNIVSPQPTQPFNTSNWSLPQNIKLADPRFNQTEKIDILIGAEFYHLLIRPNQIKISNELPILQNTALGWIVTGKIQGSGNRTATCAVFSPEDETINQLIEKFWKLEETTESEMQMSLLEKRCEAHFIQNICRNDDGRFIVRLPFSENPSVLGESKPAAFRRFMSLERRLNSNTELRTEYTKFMQEYESLGHMEEIQEEDIPENCYVMPHHCVLKPESTTTKLRVVFDASAKTSSGSSLNDILHAGPTVQSELFSILLRFRMHRFVFTADIEKMYRQILVNDGDQMFQLIFWRYNKNQDIRWYRLKTVTYGTSSAPYLATRCLKYLATQGLTKYPLGAVILRDDFYVDDCLSGADSISAALESQQQVQLLLQEAGFKLRKWCANHPRLLSGISPEDKEINLDLDDSANCTIKTLGLIWLPKSDQFCGRAQLPSIKSITKRIVSSELARIFDPLGIFGPVVVKAKIFLQQLWQLQISWDDELSMDLQNEWNNFRSKICALNDIKVERFIFKHQKPTSIQLHTFVDASERAYGASVYIRSTYADNTVATRLICSKSRVAPIKTQTLPRLELCGALLGAELANRVKHDMRLQDIETFLWSDSQIVLWWIHSSAASFHTFVANRISKIQGLTVPNQWRYVTSKENPADAISRGLSPEKLSQHSIWFYGPLFLSGRKENWPTPGTSTSPAFANLEQKVKKIALTTSTAHQSAQDMINKINHRNSFKTLQHIIAYVLRFSQNTRTARQLRPNHKSLDSHEMAESLRIIIKAIQAANFQDELEGLMNGSAISKSSPLAGLNPFLDEHQIMRIGGRLEHSTLTFEAKHPAILSHNNAIVKLLLQMLHENNRHCGPQALLAISRSQFWITNGKTITRGIVHKCVRCTRARPMLFKQLMGNLPAARVTPARPFITSGVDYFGPVWIHHKIRGKRPDKAYIAVFCCFATKAVHMEVVSNLSTEAFIAAMRRFISRRGHCKTLYCDNATNFVGASNKLTELKDAIHSHNAQEKIRRICSDKSIDFKFIPPRAPHFGGLWEAAVKSAKHLLLRSISAASLTYEELETVIVEIEAILNSRPLTPMSSNCNDLQALTPGHFLVGEPLTTAVDSNATLMKSSLDTRWKLTSELKHKFWKEWTEKYLHELQERGKWKTPSPNVNEGMLVIIKEDNTPVLQWPLGRITRVYKGDDGLVRVIDVKTASGTLKRPIHKLAPLFNDLNTEYPEFEAETSSQGPNKRQSVSTTQSEASAPKRKLVSYSSQGIFSTVLITLLLLPLILASPVNITRLPTHPGLYFEGVGSIKMITGTWKLIIYYDLEPLWSKNKMVKDGITDFSRLCENSLIRESCEPITQHLLLTWSQLIQEEDLLTPNRKRRAALNIVGNMANALFGVLDSNYAEDMAQTINNVKQNEDYLLLLIKNQTSVIDSTINILKEDESNSQERFLQLKQAIYRDLNNLVNETSQIRQFQSLMSLAIQLNMHATEIQKIQTELITALTHSNHGNISPFILTPQQLTAELRQIKGHLPPDRSLPVENSNLLELYKIMTIKGAATKSHIIFIAELPLVNQQEFELYKVIPIPARINNATLAILPNTDFLAASKHRDEYVMLSTYQLDKCTTIRDDIFLCPNLQVRVDRNAGSYSCELFLFNNKTSPKCDFRHAQNNMLLIPMHRLNHWIYATAETTELTAVCGNNIMYLTITLSGILAIEPNCVIKSNTITIRGHEVNVSVVHHSYATFGNITSIGKSTEIKKMLEPESNFDSKLEQLTTLQKQLHDIKKLPAEVQAYTTQHKSISIITLSLSVLIIMSFTLWHIKNKCQKNSSINLQTAPQPMPRQQISQI